MWPTFNILMRIISTLIGIVMILMGTVWILQGLNLAFRVGFMVGNYHWTIYGAILALVGIAQVAWSNTRQAKTWSLRGAASKPLLPSVAISAGTLMNESSRAAIVESIDRFRNAFNTGNLDEIARYYTDGMVKFRQGGPPENKGDVIRRLTETFREFDGHLNVTNDEIVVNGTFAFTRGTFVVTLKPKAGGDSRVLQRRFLEIWRLENGAWRALRAMNISTVE